MTPISLLLALAATASATQPRLAPDAWEWKRDASWPSLDPGGRRIAWIAGVDPSATAGLCVAPVASPFDCDVWASVDVASSFGWVDSERVLVATPAVSWRTCAADGCTTARPLRHGEHVYVHGGRVLLVAETNGQWLAADGSDSGPGPAADLPGSLLLGPSAGPPVAGWRERKGGRATLFVSDGTGRPRATFRERVSPGDWGQPKWQLASLVPDDGFVYAVDGRNFDRDALVRVQIATGEVSTVWEPELGVVRDVWQDPVDGHLLAVAVKFARYDWQAVDPVVADDLAWLEGHVDGDFRIAQSSLDLSVWKLVVWSGTMPAHVVLFDARAHTLTRAPPRFGVSEDVIWREMETPQVHARDGLLLPVYVTKPDPETFGAGPYPTIVNIHGGPFSVGNQYGWDEIAQRWARDGFAVAAVDFRGSSGYGWAFGRETTASQIGRAMQTDVYDAVDRLVALGVTDPQRVGYFGASYGGYSVLLAATNDPSTLTCGVSVAGPPRWGLLWPVPAELEPGSHPEDVGVPLFLVQGRRDRKVRPGSVRAFADRAVNAGADLTLLELPGQGHGLDDEPLVKGVLDSSTAFLAQCLDVPFHMPELDRALDLVVRHDAAHVPGLSQHP
jgi:dienelactone hydrolase